MKLLIKTPEQCHWDHFGVFIANFEQIYCSNPMLLLFTLNMHLFAALWILYAAKIKQTCLKSAIEVLKQGVKYVQS